MQTVLNMCLWEALFPTNLLLQFVQGTDTPEPSAICNEPSASRKQKTKRNDNNVSNINSSWCDSSGGKQQTK